MNKKTLSTTKSKKTEPLESDTTELTRGKESRVLYTKFCLYLVGAIFLFGLSSYTKQYDDILSAIFKAVAVFCTVVSYIIWKKIPSPTDAKKTKTKDDSSYLKILILSFLFIVGGTFLGKYLAQRMNVYEYSKVETFSDLGVTRHQMEESFKKQCETSQHVPEEIRSYFCPCFVQVMVGIFEENERDLMDEVKLLAQKSNIKDPKKEGFMLGKKYMDDKLQNDPAIQRKIQQCVDKAIEQAQNNI